MTVEPQNIWPHASDMLDWMEQIGPCANCKKNPVPGVSSDCALIALASLPEPIEQWTATGEDEDLDVSCTDHEKIIE